MGARIKAILASIESSLSAAGLAAWNAFNGLSTKVKAALALVLSALLVAKFRDLLIDLMVNSSKKLLKTSEQTDAKLAAKEDAANKPANVLVDQANQLAQEKPAPDDDWNKK